MKTVIRLDRSYDESRLVQDLEAATREGEFILNRPTYHDGGWRALALVSLDGKMDAPALRWAGTKANYQKTPLMKHCPYFEEIVDSFKCPVQRVRLLRLEPGANILEHVDLGDGWAMKKVRLHIPIVTNDEVYFYVDGSRVVMKPGELWYCDFTRRHKVSNKSAIARVHLVLDLTVDAWLEGLFPPEPLVEKMKGWRQRAEFEGKAKVRELARRAGITKLKKRILGQKDTPAPVVDKFD